MKDWDAIMRSIPSPPDSDAEDTLNVQSVVKNAKRVVELLHSTVPGMDTRYTGVPPMGMNRTDIIRDGLQATAVASRNSNESRSRRAAAKAACEAK